MAKACAGAICLALLVCSFVTLTAGTSDEQRQHLQMHEDWLATLRSKCVNKPSQGESVNQLFGLTPPQQGSTRKTRLLQASGGPGFIVAGGDNTFKQSSAPVNSDLKAISAGSWHSLVLMNDGRLVGFGDTSFGQSRIPDIVEFGVKGFSAGAYHNLAITSEDQVVAWGSNTYGECNVPSEAMAGAPVQVSAGTYHSLVLITNGRSTRVIGFGRDEYGQSSEIQRERNLIAIAAGGSHSCGIRNTGEVVCYGDNSYQQCAVPDVAKRGIVAVSAGETYTLALTDQGRVVAWGQNDNGQVIVPDEAKKDIVAVSAGYTYALALHRSGRVIAWDRQNTVAIAKVNRAVAISAGQGHVLALTTTQ